MRKNIITDTDLYKLTHWLQMPAGMTKLYSYGESRKGSKYPNVCFFGLTPIIQDHFLQPITSEMIDEAEEDVLNATGKREFFNRQVWEKVRDLGYLPIRIKAVAEGSIVPINNVLFTVESTEPWFADTVNSLESTLMKVWYPTTICTRSMNIKNAIKPFFDKSSMIPDLVIPVAVNDFGFRGATSFDAAALGGAAHMVHFRGSDNMAANRLIKDYYNYSGRLLSVWATEHSVATSFGPGPGEHEYLRTQLERAPDDSIISIVIDSYNDNEFLKTVVAEESIKNMIIGRQGRVVFRPDSGDPLTNMITKSEILASIFGFTVNQKGYKVISHNVGLIQGDGMDEESIPKLYKDYTEAGWAADNIITGSGGGLLQVGVNRDTQRFAVKASYGIKNGEPFNIQKNPASDRSKASKTGMLKLHKSSGEYMTLSSATESVEMFNSYSDELKTVFENGQFTKVAFENVLKQACSQ